MKSKEEIEIMLHEEIANNKRLNKLFLDGVERGDSYKDLQTLFLDSTRSTYKIVTLKEVLNHD